MTPEQQTSFEALSRWSSQLDDRLPLTFLLGFYVTLVVKRWWDQYNALPWPDSLAFYLRGLVTGGEKEEGVIIRRTVIRYSLLSYILCIRRISARLRKRYPSIQEIVKARLMRQDEAERIGSENSDEMYETNWGLPLQWSTEILSAALEEGTIKSAPGYSLLLKEIASFRSSLTRVETYGHIPVPLVYTQVVTIAVHFYLIVSLIGGQWLLKTRDETGLEVEPQLDLYYPILPTIKFLFIFGWLKVAENLYNPFGEDDLDFQLNELTERHLKVALNIVSSSKSPPPLLRDEFWCQANPVLEDSTSLSLEDESKLSKSGQIILSESSHRNI